MKRDVLPYLVHIITHFIIIHIGFFLYDLKVELVVQFNPNKSNCKVKPLKMDNPVQ